MLINFNWSMLYLNIAQTLRRNLLRCFSNSPKLNLRMTIWIINLILFQLQILFCIWWTFRTKLDHNVLTKWTFWVLKSQLEMIIIVSIWQSLGWGTCLLQSISLTGSYRILNYMRSINFKFLVPAAVKFNWRVFRNFFNQIHLIIYLRNVYFIFACI